MEKRTFIFFITLCFIVKTGKAQSFNIKSFEGENSKVTLYYKPASGMLSISYLKDTLLINNYMSVEHVKVLNKVFLQIEYVKRAGSNQDFMKLLLLYVRNGKLYQALHVNSLRTYDIRPSEYSSFKLRTTLIGGNIETCKLRLNIHNENSSDLTPKSNYNYDKINILAFGKKDKAFYGNIETISGSYTFHNLNNSNTIKKYLKREVSVVKIEKDKYYYINGNWYTRDKSDFYSMLL